MTARPRITTQAADDAARAAAGCAATAGLDEGLLQFSLSGLLHMENPYSYKKCQ